MRFTSFNLNTGVTRVLDSSESIAKISTLELKVSPASIGWEKYVEKPATTCQSSVDRVWALPIDHVDNAWDCAYQGSAILDHAEQHLRTQKMTQLPNVDLSQSIGRLRSTRTDLKAVMEYLDGISEVNP